MVAQRPWSWNTSWRVDELSAQSHASGLVHDTTVVQWLSHVCRPGVGGILMEGRANKSTYTQRMRMVTGFCVNGGVGSGAPDGLVTGLNLWKHT